MTFHFAHIAPPGACVRCTPVARWLRDARTGQPVRHWLTSGPAQPAPDALDTSLCALLARQAELRAG
ncbi:MAG: hypothetical protein ACXIU7_11510 [Roseinatronobacter sp.]